MVQQQAKAAIELKTELHEKSKEVKELQESNTKYISHHKRITS